MSLNEKIKNRRTELGLSQEYIAEQLGVSRQAISKWETGQTVPSTSNLLELEKLLQLNIISDIEQSNNHTSIEIEQHPGLLEEIVLYSLSGLFTASAYYLLVDYFHLSLTEFPWTLLGIYFGVALLTFPKVTPTDYRYGQMATSRVLFPLYYLISPVLFIKKLIMNSNISNTSS
ncbi:helix-turn-helix transcriptional regulator [Allofustis seminis]|uniref:helix-turn-helix transcriptional regulator n=1 Tax=Allofustis seminis TaxID=166939 RepID=UPI00035DF1A1|nr:helix-turn-helix transcriptional regulator [Allofustis seminis]